MLDSVNIGKDLALWSHMARRLIQRNFDKLLLTALIGVSIALTATFRLMVLYGHNELEQLNNGWLREQTALLIGALLGLVKGEHHPPPKTNGTPPPQNG